MQEKRRTKSEEAEDSIIIIIETIRKEVKGCLTGKKTTEDEQQDQDPDQETDHRTEAGVINATEAQADNIKGE